MFKNYTEHVWPTVKKTIRLPSGSLLYRVQEVDYGVDVKLWDKPEVINKAYFYRTFKR